MKKPRTVEERINHIDKMIKEINTLLYTFVFGIVALWAVLIIALGIKEFA